MERNTTFIDFETRFSDWLNSPEQLSLIPGYGWMDGGCRILAEAMHEWIGGNVRLRAVTRENSVYRIDHVVLEVINREGSVFIDADGVASLGGLLSRLKKMELMPCPGLIQYCPTTATKAGILSHPQISKTLASRLANTFGDAKNIPLLRSAPLLHVTNVENIPSILEHGIVPQLGPRSLSAGESSPMSYFFSSREDCENALSNWLGDVFEEDCDFAILEVEWTGKTISTGCEYELCIGETVHPGCITYVMNEFFEELTTTTSLEPSF